MVEVIGKHFRIDFKASRTSVQFWGIPKYRLPQKIKTLMP